MPSSTAFGPLLRQLRKRAGMTQDDLAAAVGYSASYVCDLERNRRLPAIAVILQQFVPALGLQEEAGLAAHLVELATLARGERPPPALTVERSTQLVLTETFPLSSSRLPAPPTELIGREQEINALCTRLQAHSGRLLTLVGPPGVGKTRLGLAVAGRLEALFQDGARFIALAAVDDHELVATTIANELDLPDTGKHLPQERLVQGLRRKELLLLLDNFEQVLAAAPLLATLLAECHGLRLLVTSRERLHLRAEQRFPVPPLGLDSAVDLFVRQAQMVEPGFELGLGNVPTIQAICTRLDCLPLAIELIAARIDLLSPQKMLVDLQEQGLAVLVDGPQDLPTHQRTLRTAIQYSYKLLTAHERALLRTLGVFVGGFELAALAHLGFDAATLQGLINKSLVRLAPRRTSARPSTNAGRRFLLLETLREYAREQLTACQEAEAVQGEHAAYYLHLVETTESAIRGAQVADWLDQLENEHDNLRAALTWALTAGDGVTALRLCGVLHWFWGRHGHVREGRIWVEKALAANVEAPPAVRAKALSAGGHMAHVLGDHAQAQVWVEQSLALYASVDDVRNVAEMSLQLAGIIRKQHNYARAQQFYEQSFALFQAVEDQARSMEVRHGMGNLAMNLGDNGQARMHYELALLGQRASGDKLGIADLLSRLALVTFQEGEYPRATSYCEELLALSHELGSQESTVNALVQLARIALQRGESEQAAHCLAQAYPLVQELDQPPLLARVLACQGNVALAQGDFVSARQCHRQSLQIAHQLLDQLEIASGLESLARVASAQAEADRATTLLAAAASLRARVGAPIPTVDQLHCQQLMAAAQRELGETEYAGAHAVGYAMSADQAVTFALATR